MSLVYFTDRDLGKRFPEILSAAGVEVRRHDEYFAPDCPDEDWLEAVGTNGWIAVTHDRRIRYKPNELAAVVRHKVRLLVVIGQAPYPELAKDFVGTLSVIEAFLAIHEPPLIAKVYRASPGDRARKATAFGTIVRWYPT